MIIPFVTPEKLPLRVESGPPSTIVGEIALNEVLSLIGTEKIPYKFNGKEYVVSLKKAKWFSFQRSTQCVACDVDGTRVFLQVYGRLINSVLNMRHRRARLQLYGEENGQLILMTPDHITPRSQGGSGEVDNLQTMCAICNALKSNWTFLSNEEVRLLRKVYNRYEEEDEKWKAVRRARHTIYAQHRKVVKNLDWIPS